MITEYVRYRVPAADDGAAFEASYARAAEVLATSEHCHEFELTRCDEDPRDYILRIRWDSAEGHLEGFRGSDAFPRFFAEVRPWVESIEEMRHYSATDVVGAGAAEPEPPTLYEWAGGTEAFERLFTLFYERVLADDLLAPMFAGMSPEHPRHVAAWIGEVFGGPGVYSERHGGYRNMLAHHLGKEISEAQRRRWVELLLDAADDVGLPGDAEFRAAFVGYIEWGTRLAVENSRPGAAPPEDAPIPRWGWGVAPPWQG